MELKVNHQLVKQLRLQKSWAQEILADKANVSLRTIQRIETDGVASLKSRLSIAMALEIEPSELDLSEAAIDAAVSQAALPGRDGSVKFPMSKPSRLAALPTYLRVSVLLLLWIGILIPAGMVLLVVVTGIFIDISSISGFQDNSIMVLKSLLPFAIALAVFLSAYRFLHKPARS